MTTRRIQKPDSKPVPKEERGFKSQEPLVSTSSKTLSILRGAVKDVPIGELMKVGFAMEERLVGMAPEEADAVRLELLNLDIGIERLSPNIKRDMAAIERLLGDMEPHPTGVPAIRGCYVNGGIPAYFASGSVSNVLQSLPPTEEKTLRMRFGFEGDHHTYKQIGDEIGVSGNRVQQIIRHSLRKLRHPSRFNTLRSLWNSLTVAPDVKLTDLPLSRLSVPSGAKILSDLLDTTGEIVVDGPNVTNFNSSNIPFGFSESGLSYYRMPMHISGQALDLLSASLPVQIDISIKLENVGLKTIRDVVLAGQKGLEKAGVTDSEMFVLTNALSRYGLGLGGGTVARLEAESRRFSMRVGEAKASLIQVEDLGLSNRTMNCLDHAMTCQGRVRTLGDLRQMTEAGLLKIRGFGRKGLREAKAKLAEHGFSLKKD